MSKKHLNFLSQNQFVERVQSFTNELYYNHLSIIVACRLTLSEGESPLPYFKAFERNKLVSHATLLQNKICLIYIARPIGYQNKVRTIHQTISSLLSKLKKRNPTFEPVLSASPIGISILHIDSHNIHTAVSHAIQACMEQSSNSTSKKARLRFFDNQVQFTVRRQILLEEFARSSIENNKVNVVYQPIVSCRTWRIEGYEALSRFPIEPALETTTRELISVCEDLNLISELDLLTYQKALAELGQYIERSDLFLNVNISANTRQDFAELFDCLNLLTEQNKFDSHRLHVDINPVRDSIDSNKYAEQLHKLLQHGIQISLADLSPGFDLASRLAAEKFNYLRVDDRFYQKFHEDAEYYQVIRLLAKLCHDLDVKLIVEGINDLEQARLLTFLDVDYLQGSVFTLPVKSHEIDALNDNVRHVIQAILLNQNSVQKPSDKHSDVKLSVGEIASRGLPRLHSGDKLSLANEYLKTPEISVLPVIVDKVCVGLVDRNVLNLQLTPSMGTDLETEREARVWQKPANSFMNTKLHTAESSLDLHSLTTLVKSQNSLFPIIITKNGEYYGILTELDYIHYLLGK
ncbi:EAL domain-containing protein [Vibrio sp.]|nr:EAL domain-containing protein [Vibrio sp.]